MANYTKVFNNPYPSGWVDTPAETTPITAAALQQHTDAIESVEQYLFDNPIGGGSAEIEYGTEAEFDAEKDSLPVGASYFITDDYDVTNVYSTKEVRIGTFLDEPLYRKMVPTSKGASTSSDNITSYVPADAKYVLRCRHMKLSNGYSASTDMAIWSDGSTWKVRTYEGTSAGGTMYFIFEYTKR